MKNLMIAATLATTILASPAGARVLDPARSDDVIEINKRLQCGPGDNQPGWFTWGGKVFSRRAGEPDKHLFNVEGMNVRQCVSLTDPQRGKGYRLVSREIMLYLDPKTGAVLRSWTNPWSNETVDVMHVNNDPVNSRPSFARSVDGKPAEIMLRRVGDMALMNFEAPLFYVNPLAGDYQDYTGNKYHAMEIFDFAVKADELLNTKTPTAYPTVSWIRISDWMPWMKMQGRQGQMVFNAVGMKVKGLTDLPAVLQEEIRTNYPIYTAPPPGDDARPNETTWTMFRKWIDAKRAASGATPAAGQ